MKYLQLFFLAFLFLVSCGKKEVRNQEPVVEKKTDPDVVQLTNEQIKSAGIETGTIQKRKLSNYIKASGILDLPPQNRASISTYVGGIISSIKVIQGDYVNKGQVLAYIENPQVIKIQQEYLEAASRFEFAEKEYQRQKTLFEEKIVAGKKFQATEADYKAQRAMMNSLEGQLIQIGISPATVRSGKIVREIPLKTPVKGFVHKIAVNTGSYAEPTKEIFVVVDNHHVHIDLHVYEKDVPKVKEGQKVIFSLTDIPDEQFEATIFAVGKAFEPETRSVSVHADIDGNKNKNLLPGMYVDGRIRIGDRLSNVLPEDAVVSQGNENYIYVRSGPSQKEQTLFRKVKIKTGVTDAGFTEILPLDSLANNVPVVVKGAGQIEGQLQKEQGGEEE